VTSYAEKAAAERAARRVKGVKAIAEEIEVRLPSHAKRADNEIAGRAVDILKWQVGLPADRITVKVEKGIVTLTGEVDWQFQKTDADHVVHKLTGVIDVVNQIRVTTAVHAFEVKEKIEKALERSAELEASGITVQTDGGRVVLSGRVRAWYERDIAERAAWSAPGVTEVQDHLTIEYWQRAAVADTGRIRLGLLPGRSCDRIGRARVHDPPPLTGLASRSMKTLTGDGLPLLSRRAV
jgi:osmotically-inducible protein OsmY